MADTTVTHQPATESTDRTPISEIGGHLAESRGAILKGARGLTFGETRNGSEEGGSPRVPTFLSSASSTHECCFTDVVMVRVSRGAYWDTELSEAYRNSFISKKVLFGAIPILILLLKSHPLHWVVF
ncbi:unnamed protein product [Boreogadus saida]